MKSKKSQLQFQLFHLGTFTFANLHLGIVCCYFSKKGESFLKSASLMNETIIYAASVKEIFKQQGGDQLTCVFTALI